MKGKLRLAPQSFDLQTAIDESFEIVQNQLDMKKLVAESQIMFKD